MTQFNDSMTEGLTIVVTTRGMVSLRRVGKTEDFKLTKQQVTWAVSGHKTKGNIPNEDRDIQCLAKPCESIHNFSQETLEYWCTKPSSAFRNDPVAWKKLPMQLRIESHINDYVHDLLKGIPGTWRFQELNRDNQVAKEAQFAQPVAKTIRPLKEPEPQQLFSLRPKPFKIIGKIDLKQ